MGRFASYDLHLHTEWSYDALSTVEHYFRFARTRGVRALAITDHHTMDAYGDVLKCAEKYPDVRFFAGAELTVHCPLGTYDLVCLNLPCQEEGELIGLFQAYRAWQVAYGNACSANFQRLGFDFTNEKRLELLKSYRAERILAKQGNTHVRFATIRSYAIQNGYCRDEEDYLKLFDSFVEMPDYPEYDFVIPIVKRAGGVVILAHPYEYFERDNVKRMDELREMFQLDGIECAQSFVPKEMTPFYRQYCERYGLLSSGGSDLHQPLFEGFADICGEDRWFDELLERITLH